MAIVTLPDFIKTIKDSLMKLGNGANQKATDWFRSKAQEAMGNFRWANADENMKTVLDYAKIREQKKVQPGDMFMFVYDAKWKDTLPYWDAFPLIFPIEFGDDYFIGLNLHYLHPSERTVLFNALMELKNNNKFDATTKLKLSWQVVKNMSVYVEPTVHKYLYSQVRSKFIKIDPSDWKWVVFLPFDNFKSKTQKVSRTKVWKDSRRKSGSK